MKEMDANSLGWKLAEEIYSESVAQSAQDAMKQADDIIFGTLNSMANKKEAQKRGLSQKQIDKAISDQEKRQNEYDIAMAQATGARKKYSTGDKAYVVFGLVETTTYSSKKGWKNNPVQEFDEYRKTTFELDEASGSYVVSKGKGANYGLKRRQDKTDRIIERAIKEWGSDNGIKRMKVIRGGKE